MTQLIVLVCMYMLVSIGIGLWAARRVRNTADYALAGRSLPLAMVITATFATWFGSETVLGLPGRFIEGGIAGVIEEPFGSGMALILVGMFFARKLYKMDLLTIGDFYRKRYGKKIELACAIFIILSYLGWVGAQVAALGLVLNLVTEGAVSVSLGMTIGTFVVLFYTVYGGMWSVAVTDFFQMIIIGRSHRRGGLRKRHGGRFRAGGVLRRFARSFQPLAGNEPQRLALLDLGCYHDDDRLDSAARRLPARDECA